MYITTSLNNKYSYSPRTNEIFLGEQECCDVNFKFKDFTPFQELPNVDQFIINLTEQCNLRCTYCCYSGAYEHHRSHSISNMTDEDIDAVLKFIQNNAKKFPVCVSFYGGEPLLQYQRIQDFILHSEQIWSDKVKFYVATNGVLLTHERIDWLACHHVMLAISIDGTAEIHDRQRITANGKGSYEKVYDALSYIKSNYPDYIKDNVLLLTTVVSFDDIASLAEHWHQDSILRDWAPTTLSSVAPNFAIGEDKVEWEEMKCKHESLLNLYGEHRDWVILKTYFEGCIKHWIDRPVMDIGEEVPLSTCLPLTDKLFIDTHGNLHVCEKISGRFLIGNIREGIHWERTNNLVKSYHDSRVQRCSSCPSIRVCSHCLTSIEFTEEQMDILCHNERIYTKLNFWLFCEMAERGLIGNSEFPALEVSGFVLDKITEKDVPLLMEILADNATKKFLPELAEAIREEDDVRFFLNNVRMSESTGEVVLWGIRQESALIGFIGIIGIPDYPSLFYAMHPNYRGKGIMTECVAEAVEWFHTIHPTLPLHTEVYKGNTPSIHLLQKNNFTQFNEDEQKIFMKVVSPTEHPE